MNKCITIIYLLADIFRRYARRINVANAVLHTAFRQCSVSGEDTEIT